MLVDTQCQWRTRSTKKNKSWDGDGVLVIQGRQATLMNAENSQK